MFFSKASIYSLHDVKQLDGFEDTLHRRAFIKPGTHDVKSSGWGLVRDGEMCLKSHNGILLSFIVEKKVIPAAAIKARLNEVRAELAEQQGFEPGKKATAELRERVVDELTARALSTQTKTGVWIDLVAKRLIIDSSVVGTIDLILRALMVESGVEITNMPCWSGADMSRWVAEEDDFLPTGYTIDDAIVMEYPGERGTQVAFKKADLNTPLVFQHIQDKAMVIKLQLTYEDRISFQLQVAHQLFNIKPLDVLKDSQAAEDVDALENDFVLMQLELRALIDSLVQNAIAYEGEK